MKKIFFSILGLFIMGNAYAMPATLNEKAYLKEYFCGEDGCYLTMDIDGVVGVSIQTWCSDTNYCTALDNAYESTRDIGQPLNISQPAKVTLKLVKHELSDGYIYETVKVTPIYE